jgi:molecular chaperone GrpE
MTASDQADTFDNTSSNRSSPADSSDARGSNSAGAEQSAASDDFSEFDVQLAAAKKEAADNYDRYTRAVADLENFRRRTMREKDELRQYAAGRVLEDLLPVLDNLALGLAAAQAPKADLKNLVGGIGMVQEQLKTALMGHGLKEINPAGQDFDPNLHESIASQPNPTVPEGKVAQVVRVGYSLNGRLLRPASVILSSGPATEGSRG